MLYNFYIRYTNPHSFELYLSSLHLLLIHIFLYKISLYFSKLAIISSYSLTIVSAIFAKLLNPAFFALSSVSPHVELVTMSGSLQFVFPGNPLVIPLIIAEFVYFVVFTPVLPESATPSVTVVYKLLGVSTGTHTH